MMKLNVFILFISCAICINYVSSESCAGCPFEADTKNEALKEQLTKVVNKQSALANEEPKKDIEIIKATSQVVAGIKHIVYYTAVGVNSGNKYSCQSSWVDQPWKKPEQLLLKHECNSKVKSV